MKLGNLTGYEPLALAGNGLKLMTRNVFEMVMFNVRIAEQTNDPELFKKLNDNIWEFRTKYLGRQIRILAFWDKSKRTKTLVLATNGFIKKTSKTPLNEIERAERILNRYLATNKITSKR